MPWTAKRDFYNPAGGKIKKGETVSDKVVATLPGRPGSFVDWSDPVAPPAVVPATPAAPKT